MGEVLRSSERVERSLILNKTEDEADEVLSTVQKIVMKIIEHPEEEKYRKLRKNSKVLSNKVLSRPGGRELMGWIGFESKDEVEPKIELRRSHGEDRRLAFVVNWFKMYRPRQKDAELSIRLPNGTSFRAGFRKEETLHDLLTYIEDFHAPGLRGKLILSTSRPLKKFESASDLRLTLSEAGVLPRAALLAIYADADTRQSVAERTAQEARKEALQEAAKAKREHDEKERKLRLDTINRKRDTIQQRSQALQQFSSDREAKNERIERERRTIAIRQAQQHSSQPEDRPHFHYSGQLMAEPKAKREENGG